MALLESAAIEIGTPAPQFNLPGIDGESHVLAEYGGAKVFVAVFMCNHCPYVQAIWDDLISLAKSYNSMDVQFVGINSNDADSFPEDSFENMKKYAKERGQTFPYLQDDTQVVAKAYGATCTPDIFVYDKERKLAYHGRFNNAAGIKGGGKPTSSDLKEAIDSLLAGQKPTPNQAPSIGCSIKWRQP